ncbi:MAG: hypothetical protein ACJ741_09880 [Pyrinomonadaceae bacterium]
MEMFLRDAASRRKLFAVFCALSVLLINVSFADGSYRMSTPKIEVVEPLHPSAPGEEDGKFEKVWVEHSVRVDGEKGMRIHARFTVKNSLNVTCDLIAQFYSKGGETLKTERNIGGYRTAKGSVATFVTFKPGFDPSEYADKTLFIPYKAFDLNQPGVYELKFTLYLRKIINPEPQVVGRSADYNFKYTKS